MKAFLLGVAAAIAVGIVAAVVLDAVEVTSADRFASSSTRL